MSGYFAGLMRQTGIGAAAPPPSFAGGAAPAPPSPEQHVTVDAAPAERFPSTDAASPRPTAAIPAPPAGDALPASASSPRAPSTPSIPPTPAPDADPPISPSAVPPSRTAASSAPPEVTVSIDAVPPPALVSPPAGVPERRVAAAHDVDPPPPPRDSVHLRAPEQTVLREAASGPATTPVRAIPADPPRAPETPRAPRPAPVPAVETTAEVPAPPPPARVHPFSEVMAEARRWVAATPDPGEPWRGEETPAETDGHARTPAGVRPRRQATRPVEASEEVHVSIGAITVTIEDPAAARPAPRAEPARPASDARTRMARHYLRLE